MSQHEYPERLSNRSKGFQEDGSSQPTMEVLVETLTGTAFEMTVSPSDTIFAIKSKIFRVEGIPVSQQHLVYNLRELADGASLREHGVAAGARLRLVLALRGGPVTTRRPLRFERPPPDREDIDWGGESGDDIGADIGPDIGAVSGIGAGSGIGSGSGAVGGVDIGSGVGIGTGSSIGSGASSGCKMTVLLYHEGERVNMLHLHENRNSIYPSKDHTKYSSSLVQLLEQDDGGDRSVLDNAVTMGKMIELRRRMELLSIHRRRNPLRSDDEPEIQKTRSEETLSVPSLLDEPAADAYSVRTRTPYDEPDDEFVPLTDADYLPYDCGYSIADCYAMLAPIGARTDSNQSLQDILTDTERFKLPETLVDSILVKSAQCDADEEAIEESAKRAVEEFCLQQDPGYRAGSLAPRPATKYGALVGGEARSWRRGFGSSSQLASGGGAGGNAACGGGGCSTGVLRAPRPHRAPPLSASTSDLEQLTGSRILPALSRHRNREHLHLSDERLELARPPARLEGRQSGDAKQPCAEVAAVAGQGKVPRRVRCGLCRRRLSPATEHRCRCGGAYCAPHRYAEVHGCAYDYKSLRTHRN